jgi:hypothetical protein
LLIAITVTALLVIAVRILFLTPFHPPVLVQLISTAQTINLGFSLLTNIIATAIIAIRSW